MKSVQDTYLLHNGVAIPCVGYGTCDTDGEVTVRSVKCALQAGYRLIDTAMFYKNEESVGKGIREAESPGRRSLWSASCGITTTAMKKRKNPSRNLWRGSAWTIWTFI